MSGNAQTAMAESARDRGVAAGRVPDDPVRASVRRLGIANLLCIAIYTLLAWGMVTVVPFGEAEPIEAAAWARLADALSWMGGGVAAYLRGESALARPSLFTVAYVLPIAASCVVFLALLARIARAGRPLDDATADGVLRFALAFAVVAVFAPPVLVQDFWLSAGWGRLAAVGPNPYYTYLDPDVTAGLPLDYLGLLATYGPLWVLLSSGIMTVSGTNALIAGALFKLVLGGAWIGSLLLLSTLLRERGAAARAIGIAVAGWLPLGVIHAVADGHNDVLMAFLVMLWLWLLGRQRPVRASLALAASVVVKYLSAPLFLLDLLHARRVLKRSWLSYAPRAAAVAALGLGSTAVYFRDMDFFASTRHMTEWHFFTPRAAVAAIGRPAGIEPVFDTLGGLLVIGAAGLVSGVFVAIGAWHVWRFWREPGPLAFHTATFALVAALLFGVVGHVWPWFLTWGLLLAALRPGLWLARWTIGFGIGACFLMIPWVAWPGTDPTGVPSLALCAFALLFSFFVPVRWLEAAPV